MQLVRRAGGSKRMCMAWRGAKGGRKFDLSFASAPAREYSQPGGSGEGRVKGSSVVLGRSSPAPSVFCSSVYYKWIES